MEHTITTHPDGDHLTVQVAGVPGVFSGVLPDGTGLGMLLQEGFDVSFTAKKDGACHLLTYNPEGQFPPPLV